jgi:hypothetical protein
VKLRREREECPQLWVDAMQEDLKSLEFEHKPQGMFGIGVSLNARNDS